MDKKDKRMPFLEEEEEGKIILSPKEIEEDKKRLNNWLNGIPNLLEDPPKPKKSKKSKKPKKKKEEVRTLEAAKGGYIKKYARGGGVRKTHSF